MDETRAREILGDIIAPDGVGLRPGGGYSAGWIFWDATDKLCTLDGAYTADQLEAMAYWMRSKGVPAGQ